MRKRKKPERLAENQVVQFARRNKLLDRKMNGMGARHWPDRLFLGPGGRVLFIEFKKEGLGPTKAQAAFHELLRALGFQVEVVDDPGIGIKLVEELMS